MIDEYRRSWLTLSSELGGSMIRLPWLDHPLTEKQVRNHLMLTLEDDTEEQPWMTMSDLQFWSASSLAHSLRIYARERQLPWYVASMLPILYRWPGAAAKKQLAPDVFVAFAPDHPRSSYDVESELGFPSFVLEVISPSSSAHDRNDKRIAYEELGAREYVLFTPRDVGQSDLEGYRRTTAGPFEPWPLDELGRLWSDVLGLFLVTNGPILQAETSEGYHLLTPDQTAAAWNQAEAIHRQETEARGQAEEDRDEQARARREAEEGRRLAEAELQRLREELDRRPRGL
jgi:Uma2 family endonuclease